MEETQIEIRGLPPTVKVRLDKPNSPLELRRNEVTQHAVRLQWKFRVINLPSLEKPWIAIEVLDGHGCRNTVEIWDPHQAKVTCGCEGYTRDESGWCLHTAAWKTWWKMGSLWTSTFLDKNASKMSCLASPTSQEVTKWHLKLILQLQRIPLKKEVWKVPVKVWDSWLRKCQVFGTGQVLGQVKEDPSLWKVSESTVTARRLLLLPEEALEEKQSLPDPDSLLNPGQISLYDYQKEALEKMVSRKRLVCSMSVGSGKCLRGETEVLTNNGLVRIDSLFPRDRKPNLEGEVLTGDGLKVLALVENEIQPSSVKARFWQRLSDVEYTLLLATQRGKQVEVTQTHPIPVCRQGRVTWIEARDLKVGDYWCVAGRTPPVATQIPEGFSLDALRVISWGIFEGWESPTKPTWTITQKDTEVLREIQKSFRAILPGSTTGRIITPKQQHRASYIAIYSREFRTMLQKWGYETGNLSATKRLPSWWLLLPDSYLREFLRIAIDAEGYVGKHHIEFSSASERLASQVQACLLRFGIHSALTTRTVKKKTYWRLFVSGPDLRQFQREIPTLTSHKQQALERVCQKKCNPNMGVPVEWLRDSLRKLGLPLETIFPGIGERAMVVSQEVALNAVAVSQAYASGTERYKGMLRRTSGGIVAKIAKRNIDFIKVHRTAILELARRLEVLVTSDLRFEKVSSIQEGEAGGVVYDLEVEKEDFEEKNFVLGSGLVVHNTATTIATVAVLREVTKISPKVLVVCPKSLGLQWGGEIRRLLADTQVVYTNSASWEKQWTETKKSGYARFLVTTYQYLQRNLESFTRENWDIVVADEIQYVKNGDSKTWKAMSQIESEYFYGLSGTVIENRLDDLYSVMEIVSPGRLGPLWRFLSDYQEVKEVTPTKVLYGDLTNLPDLHQKLDPWVFTLPSSFSSSRLPPLIQTQVSVTLSPTLRAHHDYHHGEAKKLLAKSLRGQISHYEKMMIQAHLLKARQACNSEELITKVRPTVRPPKVETFLTVFDNHKSAGEKLVVFSQWTEMLDILQREIGSSEEYVRFDGSMTANSRKKSVEKFLNSPECVVFLSSDAGGVGLDGLQAVATTILHTELPWNPARLDQRNGRLHRIGQKGVQVSAITMVAEDSIESKMVELLTTKREIRELALAGL